jgi:hypothetical protein
MKTLLKVTIALAVIYLLTGCGIFQSKVPAQIVAKEKLTVVPLDKNLFSCPKPQPVKSKFTNLANKEVYEKELDAAFNEAYAAQVQCYKSMVNIQVTYDKTAAKILEANQPDTAKK